MKAFWIAIVVFLGFYILNLYVLYPIGYALIPGGSGVATSYHVVSYVGNAGLAAIMVTCTYIIINKINELLEELKNKDNK